MKKMFFAVIVMLGFANAVFSQVIPAVVNKNQANIGFTGSVHDFKIIPQNIPATYTFIFTNTGKEPLVINSANASCGCTVPEYTKEPVKAGGKGSIKVTYNAAALGVFTKTITVSSNARRNPVVLTIKGEVKAKDASPKKN